MLMNKIEFWLMNNPVRVLIQRYEAKRMRAMSDLESGGVILEIGCGQGEGTNLIQRYFRPDKIYAIDLDKKMVERAKKRVKAENVAFEVGDASKLRFEGEMFDAVIDFGIIHHIPNWKDCLDELYRVLKPKGRVILEDLSIETFESNFFGRFLKRILDHPYKDMYKRKEFFQYADRIGFKVIVRKENWFWFNAVLER